MNLSVAIGMDQYTVVCLVCPTQRLIDDVVVVPTGHFRDRLRADRAETALLLPEVDQGASSAQSLIHLDAAAFFQIEFPCRIVGVTVSFNLVVSRDRCRGGEAKPVRDPLAIFASCGPEEAPVPRARLAEVMVGDPPCAFLRVPALCPLPQGVEDGGVHMDKGCFG